MSRPLVCGFISILSTPCESAGTVRPYVLGTARLDSALIGGLLSGLSPQVGTAAPAHRVHITNGQTFWMPAYRPGGACPNPSTPMMSSGSMSSILSLVFTPFTKIAGQTNGRPRRQKSKRVAALTSWQTDCCDLYPGIRLGSTNIAPLASLRLSCRY